MKRNTLESDENSRIFPVRLLLVLTMRPGNVHGSSLHAVLATTQIRKGRRVEWRGPNLLIFAKRDKARSPLREATEVSGYSRLNRPHDLRGGAAMDLAPVED